MGIYQWMKRLFRAVIESSLIRQILLPDLANAVTLAGDAAVWTNGAWTQIVASVGAKDVQITGVYLSAPSAVLEGEVDIGVGTAPAGSTRAVVPVQRVDVTAAGHALGLFIPLAKPIKVAALSGLVGRFASKAGGAQTVDVKVVAVTDF